MADNQKNSVERTLVDRAGTIFKALTSVSDATNTEQSFKFNYDGLETNITLNYQSGTLDGQASEDRKFEITLELDDELIQGAFTYRHDPNDPSDMQRQSSIAIEADIENYESDLPYAFTLNHTTRGSEYDDLPNQASLNQTVDKLAKAIQELSDAGNSGEDVDFEELVNHGAIKELFESDEREEKPDNSAKLSSSLLLALQEAIADSAAIGKGVWDKKTAMDRDNPGHEYYVKNVGDDLHIGVNVSGPISSSSIAFDAGPADGDPSITAISISVEEDEPNIHSTTHLDFESSAITTDSIREAIEAIEIPAAVPTPKPPIEKMRGSKQNTMHKLLEDNGVPTNEASFHSTDAPDNPIEAAEQNETRVTTANYPEPSKGIQHS